MKTKSDNKIIIVDLTKVKNVNDITDAFILAKVNAGVPISIEELICAKFNSIDRVFSELEEYEYELSSKTTFIEDDELAKELISIIDTYTKPKKKPWYKRFWRWITFRK